MKFLILLSIFFCTNLFAAKVTDFVGNNVTVNNVTTTKVQAGTSSATPTTDLVVVYGSVVTPTSTQSGTSINFFKSQTVTCSSCGNTSGSQTITLSGLSDGGFYTLDMTDSSTVNNTFSSSGLTFHWLPAQAARTTAKIASYNFHRVGTRVLVTWMEF